LPATSVSTRSKIRFGVPKATGASAIFFFRTNLVAYGGEHQYDGRRQAARRGRFILSASRSNSSTASARARGLPRPVPVHLGLLALGREGKDGNQHRYFVPVQAQLSVHILPSIR
jgi:hypothetical protein